MTNIDVVRAWKDAEYRQSLSAGQRAALPAHPAGLIELSDDKLASAAGGLPWTNGVRCRLTQAGAGCYTAANCTTQSLCTTWGGCPTLRDTCSTRAYSCV